MKVQVLGPGCSRCQQLEANTREALRLLGMNEPVEKVADIREIMKFGVMMTPALAINGKVVLSGKVATPAEIQSAITSAP
ncbi:TM0996/MTH895 family glutaredoxin-like protein [Candidatus Sumerlaeota bacterium]|nr:TM0996/MTH895 family glutaredoxin-like protein [Candidatus Sumerlaeota bacterium]